MKTKIYEEIYEDAWRVAMRKLGQKPYSPEELF